MITTRTVYKGHLATESTHQRSGVVLVTDAPLDNKGKGESFSSTDLLATSLGTCMLTTIAINIEDQDFNIEGASASVTKVMNENPRRVGSVMVELDFSSQSYTPEQQETIKHLALTCPVALSLSDNVNQEVTFIFGN